MSFWSTERILNYSDNRPLFDPYNAEQVKHCAIELSVGSQVCMTSTHKDPETIQISHGGFFDILPGQFALILTEEIISVPDNALGFISIRASTKFKGLINVSGFHVDPGYEGRLKFSVYNAGSQPISFKRGDNIFMLWLTDLDIATKDIYENSNHKQNGITSEDQNRMRGQVASPAATWERLTQTRADYDKRMTDSETKGENRLNEFKNEQRTLAQKIETTERIMIGLVLIVLGLAITVISSVWKADNKLASPAASSPQITCSPSIPITVPPAPPDGQTKGVEGKQSVVGNPQTTLLQKAGSKR